MTGSAVLASRAGGPAAPADHTLFVVDWDAAAADELQQQLNALTGLTGPQAAGHASAPWQVLNCPSSTVQAGQGRNSLAHGLQTLRYLGTAARAAWRSRYQGQVVVWRQAIGYLLCALPRWPRWLCPSGHRPRLILTTVLLSPSSTAPRSWGRLLLELALRRADALVYFSREMALDTARHRPAQAHKVFWMPLPQFGEPAGQAEPAAAPPPCPGRAPDDSLDNGSQEPGPTSDGRAVLSVFAGGTSDRDFDVVIEAFRDRPVPVILVCREDQRFRVPGPLGANFSVHRGVSEARYHALAAAAGVVVVALKSSASGCGQLLFSFCMRHGIPVIATDCYGTRDDVIHGHTGWLVPPGDAQALALAYDRLAADPVLRQDLVRHARARALARARDRDLAAFVQALQGLGQVLQGQPSPCAPTSAAALLQRTAADRADDEPVHAPTPATPTRGSHPAREAA